ncbi:MAG: hypothetical protein K0R14_1426 [Burkholderiales bacterium]|jgi:hypothetical protein|nr:hypothetical protein [Burkholderiales bacterium]
MYAYITAGPIQAKPLLRLFAIERLSVSSFDYDNCGPEDKVHGGKQLSCSAFDNFNLNEANLFVKQYDGGDRTYFNRFYKMIGFMHLSKP